MPTFHYLHEPLPEPMEFRHLLREASEQYDPVDELLSVERELGDLERKYGTSSSEFYTRFLAGTAGDAPELVTWAGL